MDTDFLSDRVKRGDYYFLNLSPTLSDDLTVACGGRELCDHRYVVDRRGFRYHSLEFVASGRGTVTLEGHRSALGPGSVFSYGPSIPHRIEVEPGSTMVKYFVDFSGLQAPSLLAAAQAGREPRLITSHSWIQRLFEDLKVAADSLHDTRASMCSLLVRQLLVLLTDRSLSGPREDAAQSLRFRKLKNELDDLAMRGVGLEEAARLCGVSTSYLSRLFRRFDTVTPHQYLVRRRMAFAASLLLDPQLLVKEVAVMTGYDDQYHFSRTFKTIYGHSPEAFRRLRQ